MGVRHRHFIFQSSRIMSLILLTVFICRGISAGENMASGGSQQTEFPFIDDVDDSLMNGERPSVYAPNLQAPPLREFKPGEICNGDHTVYPEPDKKNAEPGTDKNTDNNKNLQDDEIRETQKTNKDKEKINPAPQAMADNDKNDKQPTTKGTNKNTKQDPEFNNGCQPPEKTDGPVVPKTITGLRKQMGASFRVARRGAFLITSDIDKNDFATLVDGVIACCRECLQRDYFDKKPSRIVTIYVFKNEKTYADNLLRIFRMKPISPYGHYGYSQRYIVVNYDTGPGTLVHEMTHALMAPDFPTAPIWISEGIASLYEQCRVEGNSLKGEQNWRLPELKKALKEKRTTPLKTLFTMNVRDFRCKQESLHYAESRYFCKFLESKNMLRKVYKEFRRTFQIDPSGLKAVETIYGKPINEIEKEWNTWLAAQQWKMPAESSSLYIPVEQQQTLGLMGQNMLNDKASPSPETKSIVVAER